MSIGLKIQEISKRGLCYVDSNTPSSAERKTHHNLESVAVLTPQLTDLNPVTRQNMSCLDRRLMLLYAT